VRGQGRDRSPLGHLLAGRRAVRDADRHRAVRRRGHRDPPRPPAPRPPPPSTRNPSVPPAWEALCLRMLEIHKEDRPQSMQEVGGALADLDHHAAIWAAARAARAASGHSGHTLIAPRARWRARGPTVDAGSRPTLHASLRGLLANAPPTPGHGTPIVPTPAGGVPVLTPSHVVPIATPGHGIPIPMPFPMATPGPAPRSVMPAPRHGAAIPMPTPQRASRMVTQSGPSPSTPSRRTAESWPPSVASIASRTSCCARRQASG
jgi:hypothetical protein